MTTFVCSECNDLFEVADAGIVQSMIYEHLATGDDFVCPSCSLGIVYTEVTVPLYSFEKED